MFFFSPKPRKYYYGEGTDHVVELLESEADAVNKLILWHVKDDLYKVNLNRREMMHYDHAATKLNDYLRSMPTPVMASDEYLENNDVLRPCPVN